LQSKQKWIVNALKTYDLDKSDYVFDDLYKQYLSYRGAQVKRPHFTNERPFGYIITNEVELKRLEKYYEEFNPRIVCFDTETASEDDSIRKARMVGFSLSFGMEKWQNFYIPCNHLVLEPYGEQVFIDKLMKFIRKVLMREGIVLAAHNLTYDMHILANHGLHIMKHAKRLGIKLYDTMTASWLVDENLFKSLKFQAKLRLKHMPYVPHMKEYNEVVATVPNEVKRKHGLKPNEKATIDLVRIDVAGDYAINDSLAVRDLIPVYEKIMLKEEPLHDRFHYFEMVYIYEAYKMERRGTKLNMPLLRRYKRKITKHIRRLEAELYRAVGYSFSVRSTKALPKLLYEELGFPVEHWTDPTKNKSGTSNPSTGSEALETMLDYRRTLLEPMKKDLEKLEKKKKKTQATQRAIKKLKRQISELERKLHIVKLIHDVRLLRHLDSNFISGLLERQINGIIYPRFNQTGTVTGRLSSSDPNGQNMPNDVKDSDPRYEYSIRDLFIPRKGYVLLVADFSNLELRILAHIARDPLLIDMFLSRKDPHSTTAINMNSNHRLVKLGLTDAELKKLAGMDKQLKNYENNISELLKKEPKLVELIDKYIEPEAGCKTVAEMIKKLGDKNTVKLLYRLWKEAKDLRAEGKLLNFAIIYGFGDDAIAKALNLPTKEHGAKKKRDYFEAFRGVYKWINFIRKDAERKGYVETLLHKRRRKPSALQASNAPIQGTAGDIVKMAQIKLGNHPMLRKWGFHQLLQVHDEIVAEVKKEHWEKAKKVMKKLMEHPLAEDLVVPLEAEPEMGMTWNEAK
jgi:DNA polymerase I-like protein with 3'-5' exonuclease and polymerase domains